MNGYEASLKAVGYNVLDFKQFGDYSGEWCALVEDINGDVGFINDLYGSCGGCDQYESDTSGYYKKNPSIKDEEVHAKFGIRYKGAMITYESMLAHAKKHDANLVQTETMENWVKSHEEKVKKYQWKRSFHQSLIEEKTSQNANKKKTKRNT